jgi:uncharacterized membrane protein YqjE
MSATEPRASDASLGELFSSLSSDFSTLVKDEIELAKVELKDEIKDVGRAGSMFGAAALAGYMAIVVLSFAAAWGLAEVMAAGLAFLIVGVIWAAVGAVLYFRGRDRLERVQLKPEQTVQTVKEDIQWAKGQRS